jgi:NTE family protein
MNSSSTSLHGNTVTIAASWPRIIGAAGVGHALAAQIDELRAGGSRVETILPDSNSRDAFGSNLMDLSTRPPPVEPVATKAEPLPRSSLKFWANAVEISRLGRRDDTCSCLGRRNE